MIKKTRIVVTIKPDVLDPSGLAVKKALKRQGMLGIEDVRIGKVIDITMSHEGKASLNDLWTDQLKNIFCNPIVEDCQIKTADES